MDGSAATPGQSALYKLAGFTLDLERLELYDAGGARVGLRQQCLAVLECLARRAGTLVAKDELLQSVWPDVVVTEDSLVQCIKEIRRALHDDEHRLVRTEPRRGYRLVGLAPVAGTTADDGEAFEQEIRFVTTADGVSPMR